MFVIMSAPVGRLATKRSEVALLFAAAAPRTAADLEQHSGISRSDKATPETVPEQYGRHLTGPGDVSH